MKKLILFLAGAALMASSATAAEWSRKAAPSRLSAATQADEEESYMVFGYCQDYSSCLGQSGNVQCAIEIPEETAAKFEGNQLTAVRLAFGNAKRTDITVFLTDNLRGTYFYTQQANVENMEGWNTIKLDTPYEITNKKFYIGYMYEKCTQGEYPIGVDDVLTTSTLGDYIAVGTSWQHIGNMYGNICINAIIEGDNLPQYDLSFTDIAVPFSVNPGTEFSVEAMFKNNGSKAINNIDLECTLNGTPAENATYTLKPEKVLPGEFATLTVKGISSEVETCDLEVALNVKAVNGEADNNPDDNVVSQFTACIKEGFDRKIVVEEWTGTWCGYCPAGIVGMEYMKKNYGNDGFIGIAVHGDDQMAVSSYAPFREVYAAVSYPGSAFNRKYSVYPSQETMEEAYKVLKPIKSYVEVTGISAESNEEATQLNVSATVNFAAPVTNGEYALAFVVTENQVGPYTQLNYYSGTQTPMGGWEKKMYNQPWLFDDVARSITDCWGIKNSIPATLDAGAAHTYETSVSIRNVVDLSKAELVVLVLNQRTSEIINAGKISLYDAAVEAVENSSLTIEGRNRMIVFNGEYASCSIFGMDGSRLAEGYVGGSVEVPAGIYVVKAQDAAGNVITRKVLVK